MDFLKNVFGTGSNIFGASGNNTDSLVKNGLLQQTDVDKASNQSLFRGLLGTAVGYLAQPKNQGYGSSVPYIFKGLQNGMEAAQQPYSQLTQDASQNMKLQDYQAEKDLKAQEAEKAEQFAKFQQGFGIKTPNMVTGGGLQKEGDARVHQTNQNGTTTQIAPNFNPVTQAPQTSEFNANKYIDNALANGTITYDQAQKYKKDLIPEDNSYVLKEGDVKYDGQGNIIAKNEKTEVEKQSAGYREWNEMGGAKSQYPTFASYMEAKNNSGGLTINNGPQENSSEKMIRESAVKDVFVASQNGDAEAIEQQKNLDQQMRMLDKLSTFQGKGAEWKIAATQWAKEIGLDIEGTEWGNKADAAEAMRSLQIQAALGMKKPGTGPMTDKDFENFQNTVAQLGNTAAANKMIIAASQENVNSQKQYAKEMRDFIEANPNATGVSIYQARSEIQARIQRELWAKHSALADEAKEKYGTNDAPASSGSGGGNWEIVQ